MNESGLNYRLVDVRAKLSEAKSGVPISFRGVDVDDPTANSDNDPSGIIDNESLTADNRSSNWGFASTGSVTVENGVATVVTDADGFATVEFYVSTQPGDNWRVVATTNPSQLDGIYAIQDDGFYARVADANNHDQVVPGADAEMVDTQMLTAWRNLNVEVASMGPVTGNTLEGMITNVVPDPSNAANSMVTTNLKLDSSEVNRFNPGELTVGGATFKVLGNSAGAGVTLTVANNGNTAPGKGSFRLKDDDILQDGQDVPTPDTSKLADALKPVFITPRYFVDEGQIPFVANLDGNTVSGRPAVVNKYWQRKNKNSPDNWEVFVVGAFQNDTGSDLDPYSGRASYGTTVQGYGGSFIWTETINDKFQGNPNAVTPLMKRN